MKGWIHRPALLFWRVLCVSFSLILSFSTDEEVGIQGSRCVCVCVRMCFCAGRHILQFNVVSPPWAWGSFQRVRQPVVMTLFGKMAQREQSHLHWHFCHHLWLCQQAWSPPTLRANSGWAAAIRHRSIRTQRKWAVTQIQYLIFYKNLDCNTQTCRIPHDVFIVLDTCANWKSERYSLCNQIKLKKASFRFNDRIVHFVNEIRKHKCHICLSLHLYKHTW